MRLIDADALIEILTTAIRNVKGMAKFICAEDDPEIKMEIKAYTYILECVKEQPTIEPERKTGRWIEDDAEMFVRCSECGESNDYISDFCPDCGAKMEGCEHE